MPIAAFEEKYQNLHSCLVNHPRAQKFVETLYRSRAKVFFASVQHFFTVGCQSTQSGESMNSLLKHNGSKIRKNMLKTMILRQLVDAIDEIINHQYAEDIEIIKQCVAKGTKITKCVKKLLETEKLQMDQFKVTTVKDIEFVVSGLYGPSIIEQKETMKEENMQECTCESFKNMKLPCQHIAASVFHYNLNSLSDKIQFIDPKSI
jgi:SWIM zinc finger